MFLLIQYGPAIVGLLLSIGVSFARRRLWVKLPIVARVSTAVGLVTALAGVVVLTGWSTGGLLIHLGGVLGSLYGTSILRAGFAAGHVGWVQLGTSFAAIGPALQIASFISVVLGLAQWWFTLLSVVPTRARLPHRSVVT